MNLESTQDRHKFVHDMWKRTFNFQESLIHDPENGDDWLGSINMAEYLSTIDDFIMTEDIFYCTLDDIGGVYNPSGNRVYQNLVYENLVHFVDTILLCRIENTLDFINDWNFKLERGQKLKKYLVKRLETLIKKYQDIYDL